MEPLECWQALSAMSGQPPLSPDAYWTLWAVPGRTAAPIRTDFFRAAISQPGRVDELATLAKSPFASHIARPLVDLLAATARLWTPEQDLQVLDAWACGMLTLKSQHAATTLNPARLLHATRTTLPEPLPEQWLPIIAALGEDTDMDVPANPAIDPARICSAAQAWRSAPLGSPTIARIDRLCLHYGVDNHAAAKPAPPPRL